MFSISERATFEVEAINDMSDTGLRVAIATEYQKFDYIDVHASGEIMAGKSGIFTTVPIRVPDWPNNPKAATDLEDQLREDGLWTAYTENLRAPVGDDLGVATPRSARRRLSQPNPGNSLEMFRLPTI